MTSEEPLSWFVPPAASVMAPSALVLGKPAYQIFGFHRPMVGERIFPTGAGGPSDETSGRRGRAHAGRRGAIAIALRVADPREGDAAGDVEEVAIGADADTGANGRQIIGGERLRDGEGGDTVAQRVGVIAEAGFAVEVVEIALQSDHERVGLPVAADLSAAKRVDFIGAAAPASRDHGRIAAQQVRAGTHRRGEIRSGVAGTGVEADIAAGPLIRRRLRRLHSEIGCSAGGRPTASESRDCNKG